MSKTISITVSDNTFDLLAVPDDARLFEVKIEHYEEDDG